MCCVPERRVIYARSNRRGGGGDAQVYRGLYSRVHLYSLVATRLLTGLSEKKELTRPIICMALIVEFTRRHIYIYIYYMLEVSSSNSLMADLLRPSSLYHLEPNVLESKRAVFLPYIVSLSAAKCVFSSHSDRDHI